MDSGMRLTGFGSGPSVTGSVGWDDECMDMSGPVIASLCPLGSSPAGNLVMDIRHT